MDERLLNNKLFLGIQPKELFYLQEKYFRKKNFYIGEVIIEQGSIAKELYLIVDGIVKISQITESGEEVELAQRTKNDFIGELGLIDENVRASRVICITEVTIYSLDKKNFIPLIHEAPTISLNIMKTIAGRQRDSDKLATERQAKLKEINRELEGLVQKRTGELNNTLNLIQIDMELARKIQSKLLPIDLKSINNLRIESRYMPIEKVGGDFFDIVKLSETKTRIIIADATGHGVQAALITMLIKSEYERLKENINSPSLLMKLLNDIFISRYGLINLLFSCFIVDIDQEKNEITFCSAGHPHQCLISNLKITELSSYGKILGVLKKLEYKEVTLPFNKGDKLILFTDGLLEEYNIEQKEFGEENLHKLLSETASENVETIVAQTLKYLNTFVGNNPLYDDLTIIGIEYVT